MVVLMSQWWLNTVSISLNYSMATLGTFSTFGYNKTELCCAKWDQVGDSAVMVTKQLRAMKEAHGVDPTGLGRWSWLRVRGKHKQCDLCLVIAQFPVEVELEALGVNMYGITKVKASKTLTQEH